MRIAGVQTGRMTGGSARIRYYTFMKYLECDKTDNLDDADVVYFQKKSSQDIIRLACELKDKGKKIVFDCDDGDGYRNKKDRNDVAMFDLADAVTTDTEARAHEFRKKTVTPVHVVQDCIDYDISKDNHINIANKVSRIGTFGTHKVLEVNYKKIKRIPKFKNKYYITDRNIADYDAAKWEFVPWSMESFIETLKLFDLCILLHRENKIGELKSNNRLLVCMALGIPTIVSNTPAYSKTMYEADLDCCIIKSRISDTFEEMLDYEMRKNCSKLMRKYVWEKYSPRESAKQLETVFRSVYDSSF